jgi:putative transposase
MLSQVLVHKAFRYRVYPTAEQVARVESWEGALRFLWNLANEQRLAGYARPKGERVYPTAFGQMKELTELRTELPWLADVPRNVCAQLLVELDKAWQRCFTNFSRAPRWKRKGQDFLGLTESHPKIWRLDGNIVRFPKLGNLRAVIHRPIEGKPKSCTLRREGNQWFVSLIHEVEFATPVPRIAPVVALDRGVVNAVADSDGRIVESPRHYRATLKRLARAQRNVSRKKKGSKNRDKAKAHVARIHIKVARQRAHFVHQLSAGYAKSHGIVVVEKLQIGNMVKASRGLARGILDAGWGMLVEQLRYKLAWSGGTLISVPAAYSSQTCSECGCIDAASRASQSDFHCTACGHRDHADLNAAKVLKDRANRSVLLGEASPVGGLRTKKRLRVARRPVESSDPTVALITKVPR